MSTSPRKVPVVPVVAEVTDRIARRSAATRAAYLARTDAAIDRGPARGKLVGDVASERGCERQAVAELPPRRDHQGASSYQVRPSLSMSATAADGPHVPAV